jgi:hypothetical protein
MRPRGLTPGEEAVGGGRQGGGGPDEGSWAVADVALRLDEGEADRGPRQGCERWPMRVSGCCSGMKKNGN